jgi:hypothetical protein
VTSDEQGWRGVRKKLAVGSRVTGTVARHEAFGFFVTLDQLPEVRAIVELPNYRPRGAVPSFGPDGSVASLDPPYPPIGTRVEAVVVDHVEHNRQIRLSYLG